MHPRPLHTLQERLPIPRQIAQLPFQNPIKIINMFFGPLDACRHHNHRETGLVYHGCVFDDCEVDKGDLIDVEVEVTFEYALSTLLGLAR
jgi:hypothetical protein